MIMRRKVDEIRTRRPPIMFLNFGNIIGVWFFIWLRATIIRGNDKRCYTTAA